MYGSVDCSFIEHPHWLQQPAFTAGPQADAIYIWQGNVTDLLGFYGTCNNLLTDAERAKAFRYYQQTDQQRYVLQHGLLRLLLSWYLSTPAADITFAFNANKKPYLINSSKPCYFNISHSGPEMLIAIGDRELGVDIERINHQFEYRDIAAQYFSAAEVAFINGAQTPTEAFFLLWTRKEALLKACGTGINDNLPQMPALDGFHLLPAYYNNTNWLTESFKAGANCMGSLTYSSPPTNISRQQINNDEVAELLKSTGTNPAR